MININHYVIIWELADKTEKYLVHGTKYVNVWSCGRGNLIQTTTGMFILLYASYDKSTKVKAENNVDMLLFFYRF